MAKGKHDVSLLQVKLAALTRFGANVTNDSATGNRADAATARTSSSSSLRAVTIGSNTSGSKSSVRSCYNKEKKDVLKMVKQLISSSW